MKIFLMIALAVLPAAAAEDLPVQELAVPMELDSSSFNDDVEGISGKIRRMIGESRKEKLVRSMNSPQRDPQGAQKALDTLLQQYPELKKGQEPAFQYHQGAIDFWKKDFASAYKNFDTALKTLQEKYPNGLPPSKHAEQNAAFLADLYMGRGMTGMFQGRDDYAVKDMEMAIQISPKPRLSMHINKCRALIRLKKIQEAAGAYVLAYGIDAKGLKASSDYVKICGIFNKQGIKSQACAAGN